MPVLQTWPEGILLKAKGGKNKKEENTFLLIGSRRDDGHYYDLKYVEIGRKLGLESEVFIARTI